MRLCDVCGDPVAVVLTVQEEPSKHKREYLRVDPSKDYELDACRRCADMVAAHDWPNLGVRATRGALRRMEQILATPRAEPSEIVLDPDATTQIEGV